MIVRIDVAGRVHLVNPMHPVEGMDPVAAGIATYDRLAASVRANPSRYPDVDALLADPGLAAVDVEALIRAHAHRRPDHWLERTKVGAAADALRDGARPTGDFARAAGFAGAEAFERSFRRWRAMSPARWSRLAPDGTFRLALPPGYRAVEILAYHGRDSSSPSERRDGHRLWKALATDSGPVVLAFAVGAREARVKVESASVLSPATIAHLQEAALSMLGLEDDVDAFEGAHPALVGPRPGLRIARLPSAFEALCWAIIGQQINLAFAMALRRDLIGLVGMPVGGMRTHPTPAALADLSPTALTTRRFSRAKASYLIDAAQAVAAGSLPVETLLRGSAIAAERALVARRGIGTWTARYVLLRTGHADAAPVGDSALATALQRHLALPARPDAVQTAELMRRYAPDRALATVHLWASLHVAAAPEGP